MFNFVKLCIEIVNDHFKAVSYQALKEFEGLFLNCI